MKPATALEIILWIKIVFTIIAWSFPLLLVPASGFQRMGMPEPKPILFVRLLGAAFFALFIGYALGVWDLRHGRTITNTVWVGIISNGSACLLLLYFGCSGAWREWGRFARGALWLSAIITGLITVGLVSAGLIAGGAAGRV